VHVRAWQETYAHLLSAEFLRELDVERRAAGWRRILGSADVTAVVAVDTDDGSIVGWATSGPGRDDDAPQDRELEGIYVLRSHHGTGAGQGLLDAAIGSEPAFLWVAEDNRRATAFYLRNGFRADGSRKEESVGPERITTVRLVR
jgi:GNAT superfamily N-acetyltransferase